MADVGRRLSSGWTRTAGPRAPLWRRILVWLLIVVLVGPPLWAVVYRFLPPPITPLMVIRMAQGKGLDYRWRPLSQISPALVQAAVAGEDARFCQHQGFDFAAMRAAMRANERRPGKVRGGSTISQQTAKNAFLWPGRTMVRKAVEAGFTVLIEKLWGKRRIMEVYLNIVEMGPGDGAAGASSLACSAACCWTKARAAAGGGASRITGPTGAPFSLPTQAIRPSARTTPMAPPILRERFCT